MAKLERFNTPKCKFKYPFVVSKDVPSDNTIKPKFKITGIFDPKNKDHAKFLNGISEQITKAEIYKEKHPIKKDYFKDEDDNYVETGLIAITFKTDYKPTVFDAKLNPIVREENYIANDSEGYINYSTYEYKPGLISMILNSIQVTKLIEWDGVANAEAFGFKEEDGFSEFKPAEDLYAKTKNQDKSENQSPDDIGDLFNGDPEEDQFTSPSGVSKNEGDPDFDFGDTQDV